MLLYVVAGFFTVAAIAVGYIATATTKKKTKLPAIQSVEVPEEHPLPGHGVPRTSAQQITFPHIESVHSLFSDAVKQFGQKPMFGVRPLVQIIKEEKEINGQKKIWEYFQLGPYNWLTFEQVSARTQKVGSGLRQLGVKPNEFLGIYEDTRLEWSLICHACFSHSIIVTTVYANLGADAVAFAVNETGMRVMFTNGSLLGNLASAIKDCGSLKIVIYTDQADAKGRAVLEEKGINVISFTDLEALGADHHHEILPPKSNDVAVVMYTSGSTGNPKGVIIHHSSIVAAAQACIKGAYLEVQEDDCYISFLPLAHILALVAENAMIHLGICIGFAHPRSLTDASVRNCRGDLAELKPTLMAGVPTVYDRIKKGARDKIEKSGFVTNMLFNFAYSIKKNAISKNEDTPFWNQLVFSKFRSQLGGRMRVMLSGGAPLSRDTHEFLKICFSCPVLQGYGLTETCGGGTVMNIEDPNVGRVGPPLPCTQIKLVNVEEMNYRVTDDPPKGEIWIRGPNVAKGYYKNPEKTKEDFKEGGWFATGDVGEWCRDGTLRITDRIKNLVKLSHGEYIALENIESRFKNSPLVENICVYGDSEESFLVALVVPPKDALHHWAVKNNIPDADDHEKLCKNPKARAEVLNSLIAAGKAAKVKPVELPKAVYLCSEEWTPNNDLLTAAMKLKRGPVTLKYKNEIKEMYKSLKDNS